MELEKGRRARALFRDFDDCRLEDDTIWKSLLVMESAGIDIALRQPEIHAYLTTRETFSYSADDRVSLEDGFPEDLSIDEERWIVLEVRALLRRELGLPELKSDDLARWRYEKLSFTPAKPRADMTVKPFHDAAVIDRLSNLIRLQDPQLAKAIGLFVGHNTRVRDDRRSFQTAWIEHLVRERVLESNIELPDNVMPTATGQVVRWIYELESPNDQQ